MPVSPVKITSPRLKRQWEHLRREWDHCNRCPLMSTRSHVVHASGRFPCSVLFIGEAPGFSEDAAGAPFVGSSGKLLTQHFIPAVQDALGTRFLYAVCNVIGCVPVNDDYTLRPPLDMEARACRPHLDNLIHMSAPKACVLLGKVAAKHVGEHIVGCNLKLVPTHAIYHPAYILRQGGAKSEHALSAWVSSLLPYLRSRLQ